MTGGLLTGICPSGRRRLTSCLSSHPVSNQRLQGKTFRTLDRVDLTTTRSQNQPRPLPCSPWLTTTSFSLPSSRPRILNSSTCNTEEWETRQNSFIHIMLQGKHQSIKTSNKIKVNMMISRLTCPILNNVWLVDFASNLDPVLPHCPIRLHDTSAAVSAKSWLPVDTYKVYSSSAS